MTLQDVAGLLASKTVNGTLTLGVGDLGSADIDCLLTANFPQGKFILQGASTQTTADQIQLAGGSATLFGASTVPVVATFTVPNGTAEMVLVGTPASYSFGAGFGAFASDSLGGVVFGDAQFTLASAAVGNVAQGVAFTGGFTLPPALQAIAALLKAPPTVSFSGVLAWVGSLPQLTLTSTVFGNVVLGKAAFDVQLAFGSTVQPPAGAKGQALAVPFFQFRTSLNIASVTGPKSVAIVADLPPTGGSLVMLAATLDNVSLTDLAGLVTLVGGSDLSFPPNIPIASQFDLTALNLILAPATAQVVGLSLQIESAAPWTIVPNVFSVETVWVNFVVNAPFSGSRRVFTTLGGSLTVNETVQLDFTYGLPGNMLTAQLAPGSTIPLSGILSGLLPGTGLPTLTIVQLGAGLDLGTKDFQFEIDIMEAWPVNAGGATALSFNELLLFLSRTNGQMSGRIFCALTVAGTQLQFSADYQSGAGWSFAGGTLGQQNVPLTSLVNDALSLFGLSLPATAPQITLTNLQMSLATQTMDFGFACDGTVTVMGNVVGIGVAIGRTHDQPSNPTAVSTAFSGYLTIGGQKFTADFKSATAGKAILFTWKNSGTPLGFGDIATFFGWTTMPALPENLDLGLKDAEFYYDFTQSTVVFSAHSVNYGQILFASVVTAPTSPTPNQRVYLFALEVPFLPHGTPPGLQLSALPVVGDKLPAGTQLGVRDLQIIVASAALAKADLAALNALITGTLGDTALAPATLGAGLTFATTIQLGSGTQPVVVPLTGGSPASGTNLAALPAPASSPSSGSANTTLATPPPAAPAYQAGATWFNIEKSFGPVQFERIGVQYQNGTLFFLLDATLSFSALALSCEGLGVGSPLTSFSPQFHLDGIAVAFSSGPITINGGLLVVPSAQLPAGVDFEYLGAVTIAIEPWMIAGVASYAKVKNPATGQSDPSFFLFAQVTGSFGGPPAFFITGFMAGFGYNSQLTLPAPDKVCQFPFVAGLDNPALFPDRTPMGVLSVLSGATGQPAVVTPSVGSNWIAAGIMFRSFELVLGRALLVVEFGQEFEIALLGLASASLPQGATTDAYAFVELQLEVIFQPSAGYFGLTASLTPNSFVITKDCHLTGGFAFCLWFGPNTHAGDFVVTVGGYHPAFLAPAWYPQVSPVGFNWQVDSDVTIKGGAYFALTPSAIMAGGSLEVLFESGCIKAWFIAYANLLITWKPFHFEAGIGISLGAAVRVDLLFTTVTLSFELGATLELWGPPTGGVVHVHLYIVSFSVSFGADDAGATPPPLVWTDFKTLLPQSNQPTPTTGLLAATATTPLVLGVQINRGLTRQDATGTWYVRADELRFSATTAVPATSFSFGTGGTPPLAPGATAVTPPASIAIRPMAIASATAAHSITLTFVDESKQIDLSTWTQVPQAANLPEALWGAPLPPNTTPAPSSATIPGLPTGVQLLAPAAVAGDTPGAMNMTDLVDPLGGGYEPLTPATQADPIPAPVVDATTIATIGTTLGSAAAQTAQQGLLAALGAVQAAPPTNTLLTLLAAQAGQTFAQPPLRAA